MKLGEERKVSGEGKVGGEKGRWVRRGRSLESRSGENKTEWEKRKMDKGSGRRIEGKVSRQEC